MRYIPHSPEEIDQMLDALGMREVEELFATIPQSLRLESDLHVPNGVSELELSRELEQLAARNQNAQTADCFLGAGAYPHFIPSAVDAIASRSEFYTAYTPYQPELSQGTLQTVFEWQTMISGLAGREVANASMYDGASATAEAALMAMRITRRNVIRVSPNLHPHYRQVLETYVGGLGVEVIDLEDDAGITSQAEPVSRETACLIVQQPNFLGCVEDLSGLAEAAHAAGALLIVCVNEALSLAFLTSPGEQGADIVCGEAQSFGVPLGFGGPHLGFLAGRLEHVRQMPGRLAGETTDTRGRRGYVLTLSAREQHIRRERATSNICTNQGLCLLMATVYLALHGKNGLRELALRNYQLARYARERVQQARGLSLAFPHPVFNEFVVRLAEPASAVIDRGRDAGVLVGVDLSPYRPELGNALLVCVTELMDRPRIDRWFDLLESGS